MGEPSALSSWQPTEEDFTYKQELLTRRPRAWERAPTSPHAPHHKGRKVWKRPELWPKEPLNGHEGASSERDVDEERNPLRDVSRNSPRPVKRLRLKDAPQEDGGMVGMKSSRYFTTLRDSAAGTPKRKYTIQNSIKPDRTVHRTIEAEKAAKRLQSHSAEANFVDDSTPAREGPVSDNLRSLLRSPDKLFSGAEEKAGDPLDIFQHVPKRDIVSPAPISNKINDAEIFVDQTSDVKRLANETPQHSVWSETGALGLEIASQKDSLRKDGNSGSSPGAVSLQDENHQTALSSPGAASSAGVDIAYDHLDSNGSPSQIQQEDQRSNLEDHPRDADGISPSRTAGLRKATHEATLDKEILPRPTPATPVSDRASTNQHSKAMTTAQVQTENQQALEESPQIGATLLRRESLRRKESPQRKAIARKSGSPQKRQGLKKRDTLQEREILQQFSAAVSPGEKTDHQDLLTFKDDHHASDSAPGEAEPTNDPDPARGPVLVSDLHFDHHSDHIVANGVQRDEAALDETIMQNTDLQRAVEAIDVCKTSKAGKAIAAAQDASSSTVEPSDTLNQANQRIANLEMEQAAQTIATVCDKTDLLNRKTRSGARFSDDTTMLKEFLNRAQARRAAKDSPLLSMEMAKSQSSPRRTPRKAPAPHPGHTPSPQKSKDIRLRPGTPPRMSKSDAGDSDDVEDTTTEPVSCRRSTRTRLPAPSKTPPGAPSLIPVRRADGAEPVIIQRSQAQELATMTRANTRRNKGQSKPPLLALQDLPADSTEVGTTATQRVEHAKTVAWAEKLASYQDTKETAATEEGDDTRTKVRRMRGLGAAVNGTPAAKRTTSTTAVAPSNGTPAPKRRGKIR